MPCAENITYSYTHPVVRLPFLRAPARAALRAETALCVLGVGVWVWWR